MNVDVAVRVGVSDVVGEGVAVSVGAVPVSVTVAVGMFTVSVGVWVGGSEPVTVEDGVGVNGCVSVAVGGTVELPVGVTVGLSVGLGVGGCANVN